MTDIVIIGGGPVGATLALGLAGSGLQVSLLEARENTQQVTSDPRAIALSKGSKLILQGLGVWDAIERQATPIDTIHISQKKHFGKSVLHAKEFGDEALGYVVAYAELAAAIDQALQLSAIRLLRGAKAHEVSPQENCCEVCFEHAGVTHKQQTALTVLADGGNNLKILPGSMQRQVREYGQSALVARVEAELSHQNIAFERFAVDGPVALLPWGDHTFGLVWTTTPARAETLCKLKQSDFLAQCHDHFGDRVGNFVSVSGRKAFPLKLSWVRPSVASHFAIIGNAAQTLHPVAGQGFNLGLRDAWELAELICATPVTDIGGQSMLKRYQHGRRIDTYGGMLFTDFLVRSFSNNWPGMGVVRGLGLAALELCQPARSFVIRKMSLGARG